MAVPNNKKNQEPLGKSIRDLINPALDDSRRQKIQLDHLNDAFQNISDIIEEAMTATFQQFFRQAAARGERSEQLKNAFVIDAITLVKGQDGEPRYSPVIRLPIPISTAFTNFSADEVRELPAYIELHEKAREMDISLRVTGLTVDETKNGSAFQLPPFLIIDGSKSYNEGAAENATLYPNLPPRKVVFDAKSGDDFSL